MVTIDERQAFADRLNLVLDAAGFPPKGSGRQMQLAKDWGLSQKGVRKWLEGEGVPETTRLVEMAKRYDVSFEWLATGRDPVTLMLSTAIVRSFASARPASGTSLSSEAKQLMDAIESADSTGMPVSAFRSMSETLKVFEHLRSQDSPRRLDVNAPSPGGA